MAKIFGLNGAITGRQGNNVFAIRAGQQVLRKYQPVVFNPNSEAQVAVRSRMKLMSQLSAVMASAIAIPREGMKSARNQFTSINFRATTFTDGAADIDLTKVKLTKGVVSMPGLVATRTSSSVIEVNVSGIVSSHPFADVDRVEYYAFIERPDGTIRLAQSASSSTLAGGFPVSLSMGSGAKAIVYAYGVRFNSEAAKVRYGNITVVTAEDIARLVSNRVLQDSDVTVTDTNAAVVDVLSNAAIAPDNRESEVKTAKKSSK